MNWQQPSKWRSYRLLAAKYDGPAVDTSLRGANLQLRAAGIESAALESELLVAHVLGVDRAHLLAHPEQRLTATQHLELISLLERRTTYEPLAYLIGKRWFFGLELHVAPGVLIPRPETEHLVEQALSWLGDHQKVGLRVVDIGTGSGAIAIAVAKHAQPDVCVLGIDISEQALNVARRNAKFQLVSHHIEFLLGDLLNPLSQPVDLILANLPYIPSYDIEALMPDVCQYEPRIALDGGHDGLQLINRLLKRSGNFLNPRGALIFEIGYDQAEVAAELGGRYYPTASITVRQDLAGLDRLLIIQTD